LVTNLLLVFRVSRHRDIKSFVRSIERDPWMPFDSRPDLMNGASHLLDHLFSLLCLIFRMLCWS
jgi:hypothetical protein